jgi:uncharacterized protein (DUF1697 family)
MYTFISMLRGINVSGRNRIPMAELKHLYESLNLTNVVTYVQSGNVVFDCAEADAVQTASSIETAITRSFGFSVPVLIRDKSCFQRLIDHNPFATQRHADLTKLHVTFLSASPSKLSVTNLVVPSGISDEFILDDKELYLFCPNGYGESKLSNSFFERKLGVTATTRNWNTVNALYNIANQR